MIIEILLGISAILNIGLTVLLVRASKKLLQFDDVFVLLGDDVAANIKFFEKLVNTPILQNTPEIVDAQKHMKIIRNRLGEFALRLQEAAHRTPPKEGNGS